MKLLVPCLILQLTLVTAVGAQVVPIPKSDFDEAAAQYRNYALGEFQSVVNTWVEAVNADRPDGAAKLYTEDAYLDIEVPARGREAVRDLLRSWTSEVSHVQVGLSDFDASGNMAYGTLQVRLSPTEGSTRSGTLLLVMRKEGRNWRIRAQTLSML